ncbi:MAG: DUF3800 domain-containing protein [Polyangiaceae bacterium]
MDPADESPLPDHKNYLVYCDESGVGGQRYYGFGSLWMPWERRGDFSGLVKNLREKHGNSDEIKWNKVTRRSQAFYEELAAEFFKRSWLMFHCLIVRRGYVERKHHKDMDQALRKHFAMLIKSKVKYFSAGDAKKAYHIRVDPLPSRYGKADEAAHKIINNTLKKELGLAAVSSLFTRDSKATPGIMVADVLLGAVMAAWQGDVTAGPKLALMEAIADHLGWGDLKADTRHSEWKFNIWYFHDPSKNAAREAKTRGVKLKVPMPPLRLKT